MLLDVIAAQGLELEERPFTVEEAYAAREAFVTSASQLVMPVVRSTAGRSATARRARRDRAAARITIGHAEIA